MQVQRWLVLGLAIAGAIGAGLVDCGDVQRQVQAQEGKKVRFERRQLDPKFRSEGVAMGDFNKDGKQDLAAGFVWYEAPEWKMHLLTDKAPEYDPKGYSNSFCNWADDLNGDGWTDLIVVDFPGQQTWWFENPKEPGKQWERRVLTPITNNESPTYLDVDGDGKRDLLCAFAADGKPDGAERQMAYFTRDPADPNKEWKAHPISTKGAPGTARYAHGLGLGDINGDKKLDVLCAEGWWENPGSAEAGEWKFNGAPWGGQAAQMYAYDFDGDGDNDVITSSPHAFGLWWHEQVGKNEWKQHEIDKSFSQIHGVWHEDMNGDKLPDIVCGKRWWAHAAGDPGVDDPAVFFWFELKQENGRPSWIAHQFDHDSGPGTQFEVNDINGDGLPDVLASNKKGVHVFTQSRE
jgi:hypothetical protein